MDTQLLVLAVWGHTSEFGIVSLSFHTLVLFFAKNSWSLCISGPKSSVVGRHQTPETPKPRSLELYFQYLIQIVSVFAQSS